MSSAPPSHCPTCGLEGQGAAHSNSGINTGDYLCPAGHIWRTTWPMIGATN